MFGGFRCFIYLCTRKRESPVRPAPFESPIAARVVGCSGAMQIAFPPASLAQLARARDL